MRRPIASTAFVALALLLGSCATSPLGRQQLLLADEAQLAELRLRIAPAPKTKSSQ